MIAYIRRFQLQVRSTPKVLEQYTLHITSRDASGVTTQDATISAPYASWFSADQAFHAKKFRAWLASEVAVLKDVEAGSEGKGKGE